MTASGGDSTPDDAAHDTAHDALDSDWTATQHYAPATPHEPAAQPPVPAADDSDVPAEPDVTTQWNAPQSDVAASEDALSDHLAIAASVDDHDAAAPGFDPVPSPPQRAPGSGRHRLPGDTARFDAAGDDGGAALPPSPGQVPPLPGQMPPLPGQVPPLPGQIPPLPGQGAGSVTPEFDAEPPSTGKRRWFKRGGPKRPHKKAPWWELPLLVGIAVLIAVLVKSFVVQPFYIPSASMEKTLAGSDQRGHDRILVNKPIYDLRDPHPGDIVVFHAPSGWNDEPPSQPPSNPVLKVIRGFGQLVGVVPPDGLVLVKRVIAVGGQTVKGDSSGHVLISNNGPNGPFKTLDEPYVFNDNPDNRAAFGPITVPKGRLWVMGDHRSDSKDSRYHCGTGGADNGDDGPSCDVTAATVPVHDVIGKAVLVAWPPSHWRTLGTPSTFKHGGSILPIVGGSVLITPLYLIRRRRRRI